MHVSIASPLMQPSPNGRRVGIRIVTFEACSGFTHVTAHRIAQSPKRPLSRGSGPASYPAEPLVSYQINRQLSGWNLPPLMIRAFGAHGQKRTLAKIRLGGLIAIFATYASPTIAIPFGRYRKLLHLRSVATIGCSTARSAANQTVQLSHRSS